MFVKFLELLDRFLELFELSVGTYLCMHLLGLCLYWLLTNKS